MFTPKGYDTKYNIYSFKYFFFKSYQNFIKDFSLIQSLKSLFSKKNPNVDRMKDFLRGKRLL